jgi:FkbH-like protein
MAKPLTKEIAQFALDSAGPADLAGAAAGLIARAGNSFCLEAGEIIADQLAAAFGGSPRAEEIFRSLANRDTPLARFVSARFLAQTGAVDQAVEAFGRTLDALPAPDAWVLLQRTRLLAQLGRMADAAADLQGALRLFPPYSFFVKSEKLLHRIAASGQWQPRRTVRAALLGSSTTALLRPVLQAAGFRCNVQLEIYEGPYGNYRQEILDPGSGLYRFQPEFVFIIPQHRELALPAAGGMQQALEFAAQLRQLWDVVRQRATCHVVQAGFDVPSDGAWSSLEDTLPEGRRRVLSAVNLALAEALPTGVSFLDVGSVATHATSAWCSASEWHSAKQYPAAATLPLFADYLLSHCMAVLGLSAKVLAVDLDNTLWGGVIGEDLLGGIRIGPPTAEGEAYQELQQYLKDLQRRGILLAVCSKNNPADAELPFRQHDSMPLRLEDFVAFRANWDDKATNLQVLAQDLSLGLDSFVFLDDNPLERALVRARLPHVTVPECGVGPTAMLAALHRGLYFPALVLTDEDRARHSSYQGNSLRRTLQISAASLDDFLASLEMVAQHGPVNAATLARVTQLINKTNQFNLTTRRYSEEQVRAMADSTGWWCRWFKLADRFGDHGLIGVMLVEKQAPAWRIDTWLMSCRILGRQMEDFMFSVLQSAARGEGATYIRGQYLPTPKNGLVEDLYPRLGFVAETSAPAQYAFDLGRPTSAPRFIRNGSAQA